jgi:hypothetical protein
MQLNIRKWPLRPFVVASVVMSLSHAVLQTRWTAIRYRVFGPRPSSAQLFIAIEVLLLMILVTISFDRICSNEQQTPRKAIAVFSMILSVAAWLVVSFCIQ